MTLKRILPGMPPDLSVAYASAAARNGYFLEIYTSSFFSTNNFSIVSNPLLLILRFAITTCGLPKMKPKNDLKIFDPRGLRQRCVAIHVEKDIEFSVQCFRRCGCICSKATPANAVNNTLAAAETFELAASRLVLRLRAGAFFRRGIVCCRCRTVNCF